MIDPFPIAVHGRQEDGAYHGYYRQTMYYPLVARFSAGGDYDAPRLGEGFVHAILRRGNAHGAEAAGVLWGRLLDRAKRWWRDEAWGRDAAGRRQRPRPRRWVAPPSHAHLCLVLRE